MRDLLRVFSSFFLLSMLLLLAPQPAMPQSLTYSTVAGGYKGDGSVAWPSYLWTARWLAAPKTGDLLYSEYTGHRVRSVLVNTKAVTDFAGNGQTGPLGDGGQAVQGCFYYPGGVVRDSAGNTYVADTYNQMIRKIDASGVITTIAGTGYVTDLYDGEGGDPRDDRGDNGPAVDATFFFPFTLAYSAANNTLYVGEDGNFADSSDQSSATWALGNRIRAINLTTGVITTFAGNGVWTGSIDGPGGNTADDLGDNGPATAATFQRILGMAVSSTGELYIADVMNYRVRKVDATGVIRTVAGNGIATFSVDGPGGLQFDDLGDNGPATSATLNGPAAVALDSTGRLLIADNGNQRIRRVDGAGQITTVVGSPVTSGTGSSTVYVPDFAGDGGPALASKIAYPWGLVVDGSDNIYFSDAGNQRIRWVNGSSVIDTIAGVGDQFGDNVPATSAAFNAPYHLGFSKTTGKLYIPNLSDHKVREMDTTTGNLKNIAGTGVPSWGIDGQGGDPSDDIADNVPATSTTIRYPYDAEADSAGNVYIVEAGGCRIRKVDTSGMITTFAGSNQLMPTGGWDGPGGDPRDDLGDNGLATSATFYLPGDLSIAPNGDFFIADAYNQRIRMINHLTLIINTVAGNGVSCTDSPASYCNNCLATTSCLAYPWGCAVDSTGSNLYLTEMPVGRVRRVNLTNGMITTIAGTGYLTWTVDGQGGDPSDDLFDCTAGVGCTNEAPAGSTALNISFYQPDGIAVDSDGKVYVGDYGNHRLRVIDPATGSLDTLAGTGTTQFWDGFYGDGLTDVDTMCNNVDGVAIGTTSDVIYFSDTSNNRVRKIAVGPSTGFSIFSDNNADPTTQVATGVTFPWTDPQLISATPAGQPVFYKTNATCAIRLVKSSDHVVIYCN
jgi:sugar lactone lactonase YvrE